MYRVSQIEIGQLEPSLLDSDFVTRLSDFGMKLKVILNRSFMTGHFQTYRLTAEDESALNVRWRLLMKFLFGLRIKIIEGVWLKVFYLGREDLSWAFDELGERICSLQSSGSVP